MTTEIVSRHVDAEATDGYPQLEQLIAKRAVSLRLPLFTTDAANLYDVFLAKLPEDRRQHYDCMNCRKFVDDFGGLVTIDAEGKLCPALWHDYVDFPEFFRQAVFSLAGGCRNAKVTGVFRSDLPVWGVLENVAGPGSKCAGTRWTHLSGKPVGLGTADGKAEQKMAEKREEYVMLKRGLADFGLDAVKQALHVLKSDALDRSEKAIGVAEWLVWLHEVIADKKGRQRDNIIWLAVAKAPPGFCHVRSTMIATLLDDVKSGLPFDSVKRRWAEKMHPLRYQRPTAAPSDGAIEQAEKLFSEMGLESALRRRFAKVSDILVVAPPLWMPRAEIKVEENKGGIFDHLKKDKAKVVEQDVVAPSMTFDKFRRTVLPDALSMEFCCAGSSQLFGGSQLPFYGMTTAADPTAKPILQWDGLEGRERNPLSWYFYMGGSTPAQWGLTDQWVKVAAVTLQPNQWQEPERFKHQGEAAFFVLEGAKDQRVSSGKVGAAVFPETLRNELHGIRAVIEAHSLQAVIEGAEEASANGVAIQKNYQGPPLLFRVRTKTGTLLCRLDRWD